MRFKDQIVSLETDVLVLGGGGAGLRAAIAAKDEKTRVTLISKGKVGRSNNTVVSGGIVAAACGWLNSGDDPEIHAGDTLLGGRLIGNKDLIKKMTTTIPGEITTLERLGVPFLRTVDGHFKVNKVPGHTFGRNFVTQNGMGNDYTRPLISSAKGMGVRFIEDVFVTKLMATSAGKTGVLGFSQNLEPVCISAKASVLAAGGGGRIFAATNNPPGITADGYALVLREGLPLINMEMIQFYPTHMAERGICNKIVWYEELVYRAGGILRNSIKEDIISKHHLWGERMTRDSLCRGMMAEILEGNSDGGFLELDLSHLPQEDYEKCRPLLPSKVPGDKRNFKITPVVHFFMGGVPVDTDACTGTAGLFAAGEVTGGIHGANRLGGNALAEVWSFGRISGENALKYAEQQPSVPTVSRTELYEELERWQEAYTPLSSKKGAVADCEKCLREAMWESAGPVRNGRGILRGKVCAKEIRAELMETGFSNAVELRRLEQVKNMALVAETILTCAEMRLESRGAHYREDFPQEEKRWQGATMVKLAGDQLTVEFIPSHIS